MLVYIESFSGATIDNSWRLLILLGVGLGAVGLPIRSLKHRSSQDRNFNWKGFARGMPDLVGICGYLLILVAIANFVWYYLHGGPGVPEIKDGQYVLNSRGRILKLLTQAEYLTLREEQLRIVASLIISSYYMPLVHWWFRWNHPKAE